MAAEFGDLFEHEITNTLNHRKEKATIPDKEIRRHYREKKSLNTKLLVVINVT